LSAGDRYGFITFIEERGVSESERHRSKFDELRRERVAMLDTLEVLYIGGNKRSGEIVHALVKTGLKSNFDVLGFKIKPKDVL
jgi:hypothetical protein